MLFEVQCQRLKKVIFVGLSELNFIVLKAFLCDGRAEMYIVYIFKGIFVDLVVHG